jgi:hypothetical protein
MFIPEEIVHVYSTHTDGNPNGPRRRWEDNIKTYLKEIEFEDVDCIHLAQDTVSRQWL